MNFISYDLQRYNADSCLTDYGLANDRGSVSESQQIFRSACWCVA